MTASVAEQLPPSGFCEEPRESRDFDAIYQTYYPFVWRSLQTLGVHPAAADDATQDTFVVVHRRMADLQPDASVKAWLFGIAVRVARDYRRTLRRKGTSPLADADREISQVMGPFDRAAEEQAYRMIEAFLLELDDDKRVAFVMSELEGMTAPEIAEALGINLNTVYSRIRTARERFVGFVRERVTAMVAGGMAVALASKTLAQKVVGQVLASALLKLTVASAALVTAGTLTLTAVRPPTHATVHPSRREVVVRGARADDSRARTPALRVEARQPTRARAARHAVRARRKHELRPHEETLQAEMQVLNQASSALIRGEATTADAILASYRSSFARPKLQAEHDGLRVMADCLLKRAGSRQRAADFLALSSRSVLAPRIARACGVERFE